ncbi:M48 family metallopeptidase [Marinibaculum pumilum]|uniref:M48 family metallopeptidase n=1 Tax=Marinibaculum pumilum TaxID=1766165 RepID=A0ABV7L8A0_9PROT
MNDRVAVTLPCGTAMRLPLVCRRNPRARRAQLRVDSARRHVALTLPPGFRQAQAEIFLQRHAGWLASQIAALPPARPFRDGVELAYRGEPVRIRHDPALRGTVLLGDGELVVGGAAEFVPRRLSDWLRGQARAELSRIAMDLAAGIDRRPRRVAVRELHSRWGSCAPNGNLSFAWRLILAPPEVLTYVAAHEVAHLRHANHGPAFWALVREMMPATDVARRWLRENGSRLFAYGAEAA